MEDALQSQVRSENCPACLANSWRLLGLKNGYNIYRCHPSLGGCGTISVLPTPTPSKELYARDYFEGGKEGFGYVNYDSDKAAQRGVLINILRELELLTPGRRILDVGAATGYFLNLAWTRGWLVKGVEISPFASQLAKGKGIDVVNGVPGDLPEGEQFDVITLWDVIEHLPDPNSDLALLAARLSLGGLLAVITPDSSALYARARGLAWHLLVPPEHINCFSRLGLGSLLARHGFKILSQQVPGKWFSLSYSFHILGTSTGHKIFERLSRLLGGSFLGKIALPINFRDNVLVIARKK